MRKHRGGGDDIRHADTHFFRFGKQPGGVVFPIVLPPRGFGRTLGKIGILHEPVQKGLADRGGGSDAALVVVVLPALGIDPAQLVDDHIAGAGIKGNHAVNAAA